MKNITLSADESLIQQAKNKARAEQSSLNQRFREWLREYVGSTNREKAYDLLMKELQYVSSGKTFTRDEMNEH